WTKPRETWPQAPTSDIETFDAATGKWSAFDAMHGVPLKLAAGDAQLIRYSTPQPQSRKDERLETIRSRFVQSLIPTGQSDIDDFVTKARKRADELADATWPDLDYADVQRARWPLGEHLGRTLLLGKASYLLRSQNKPD